MRAVGRYFFFLALLYCLAGGVWAQQYIISTLAGGGPPPTPVPGVSTGVSPTGVATDSAGNAYFSSVTAIFKIDASGTLTRVAGTGKPGYSGDGGPATSAQLNDPTGLAVDAAGNVYIADYGNNRVRRVAPSGIITTIAGSGRGPDPASGITSAPPDSGDAGPAVIAVLDGPTAVAVDAAGNLYIGDNAYGIVRKVAPSGIISTVAGGGNNSRFTGLATDATITVSGLAVDAAGNLYIATGGGIGRVLKVDTNGVLSTVAGGGTTDFFCDGGPATSASISAGSVAVDSAGDLYITNSDQICKVAPNGIMNPVVAAASGPGFSGDGGPAMRAQINNPVGVAVDAAGNIYIADFGNRRVRRTDVSGIMSTVAGNGSLGYSGDGGPATSARLNEPFGIAVDASGDVYIADSGNNRIRKVTANGIISTVAGNGSFGYLGFGGPATSAQLQAPKGVAVDGADNLYITDGTRVLKVSANGILGVVAGVGPEVTEGGLAVDAAGNLYISEFTSALVRKVSANGTITTVAGNGCCGIEGNATLGDGGPATSASLWGPEGLAFDTMGNLFIADSLGERVRKVSTSGIINTVAGRGQGGLVTSSSLSEPQGVAVDGSGNLYIADGTARLQKVTGDGTITTVAGYNRAGYSGDGGLAANALMGSLDAVAVDGSGNIYVTDFTNNVIRMLKPTNQSVLISAVVDAASESATAISPGKIVVIYGSGLGPATLAQNQPSSGVFGEQIGGTSVTFNGIPAPIIYASSTQVAAIAPYGISGSATAQVVVTSTSGVSTPFVVPVVASAPSFFSVNESGAGQIAAVNLNGTLNDAAHPVSIGGYVSLYATGEGQTSPAGVDGKLALNPPYPAPALPVSVTIGGVTVTPTYAGAAPTEVAGLMQIVVQIPPNVQPGGYVPVVLTVGNASTVNGAAWIAVAGH